MCMPKHAGSTWSLTKGTQRGLDILTTMSLQHSIYYKIKLQISLFITYQGTSNESYITVVTRCDLKRAVKLVKYGAHGYTDTKGFTSLESIFASSLALRMRLTIHLSASSGDMLSLSASMLFKRHRDKRLRQRKWK